MQLAVDVSNYSGPISATQARCLRDRGVAHLIAGTQVPSVTRAQLEAALAAGMTADAYVYLYWRRYVRAEVHRARETVSGLDIGRLWLDCEDSASGLRPAEIVDLIAVAVEACGDVPAGIYTGRWWWPAATGDSQAFSRLPLWHAEYTSSPQAHPDFAAFRPYGGWIRPAMWQYQGTTALCGVSVDLNLRDSQTTLRLDIDSLDLALLRASQRFDRARALGRYVFRPAPGDASAVELQRIEDGRGVSFDPPVIVPVD